VRILMVSPYAPIRDGIAAYALQTVRQLRRQGNEVDAVSPVPSAARYHLRLTGWRGPLALARMTPEYDRVIVQFHPDMFYPRGCLPAERVAVSLGLALALRRSRRSEVVVHEIDYNRLVAPLQRRAFRTFLDAAGTITVHTKTERARLARALGLPMSRIGVREHNADFEAGTHHDRSSARASLGIPSDAHVFLCIGFLQPHKGFDRALRAFAALRSAASRLYVVGSVRVDEPEYALHAAELRALAEATPGAELRNGYLTDELFDRWIVAADTVVLPYRLIWSSGVMGRAALLHRPVIASNVGGLRDQAPEGTVLVDSDAELLAAMRHAVGGDPGAALPAGPAAAAAPRFRAPAGATAEAILSLVRARASEIRQGSGLPDLGERAGRPSEDRLVALAPLQPPTAGRSGSRLRRDLKRAVARLTRWEIDPLVQHVNALHAAVLEALSGDRSGDSGHG
jgi:glycosyltransferase involved in cell wall biosynthesis